MQNKNAEQVAVEIVKNTLQIRPEEKTAIIVDESTTFIAEAFEKALLGCGVKDFSTVFMKKQLTDGSEPPTNVTDAMKEADVIIVGSRYTLTHGKGMKEAIRRGARALSMPGTDEEIFLSPAMTADYADIAAKTVRLSELFSIGSTVSVKTDKGTNLRASIGGWDHVGGADTGYISAPGILANLPAGEALISPLEGTAKGTVVVDAVISGGIGKLQSEVRIDIEKGRVVDVQGGAEAAALRRIFEEADGNGTNVAEIALGVNPYVKKLTGNMVPDEKIQGTAHIGIGNSTMLGGSLYSGIHIDALFFAPYLSIDGELMVEKDVFHLEPYPFEDWRNIEIASLPFRGNTPIDAAGENAWEIRNGLLYKRWRDVMGHNHSTRVGNPETSELCGKVLSILVRGRRDPDALSTELSLDHEDTAKIVSFLQKYRLISL